MKAKLTAISSRDDTTASRLIHVPERDSESGVVKGLCAIANTLTEQGGVG